MSNPSSEGQCCVCGASSTQRCSACGKAGFDLFFCSQEHQKLVWSAHKLSCGMGTTEKPFRFPPLTKEEVNEVRPFLWTSHGTSYPTLAEELENILDALTRPNSFADYPPSSPSAAIHFVRLTILNSMRDQMACTRRSATPIYAQANMTNVFAQPVFPFDSAFKLASAFPVLDPLYVRLHHYLLVKSTLEDSAITRSEHGGIPPLELFSFSSKAHAVLAQAIVPLLERYPHQAAAAQQVIEGTRVGRLL
ncbi:hypothetical protein JCM8097_002341 [Rhodosporidiobolus ruineniae]